MINLIIKAQGGDREAQGELIKKYHGIIRYIAYKYVPLCSPMTDFDDLCQHGALGLLDGLKRFDTTRGVKFMTYVYYYIRREIQKCIQDNRNFKMLPKITYKKNCSTESMDFRGFDIDSLTNLLDNQSRDVILKRLEGYTLSDIGREYGVTRQRIDQIEKSAIRFLQDCVNI